MKALELLEEIERQIIEWGYVNCNTSFLMRLREIIKELQDESRD